VQDIFLSSRATRPALPSTQFPIQCAPATPSPGIKRPGCNACHSPSLSVKVKNSWSYTSTPHKSEYSFSLCNFLYPPATFSNLSVISGFRRDAALLGYYAVSDGKTFTDVSGQRSSPILKGQEIQWRCFRCFIRFLHPWKWDRYVVPKLGKGLSFDTA
jgi:hypothetical protein